MLEATPFPIKVHAIIETVRLPHFFIQNRGDVSSFLTVAFCLQPAASCQVSLFSGWNMNEVFEYDCSPPYKTIRVGIIITGSRKFIFLAVACLKLCKATRHLSD